MTHSLVIAAVAAVALLPVDRPASSTANAEDVKKIVAALDTEFQLAVKHNDAATIDRIVHPEYILVNGRGQIEPRDVLLENARTKRVIYEQQDEEPGTQAVRVYGDTAVVTAKLWIKGVRDGKPIDFKVWFSDTYVKTPAGWKYFFGQASLALPPESN